MNPNATDWEAQQNQNQYYQSNQVPPQNQQNYNANYGYFPQGQYQQYPPQYQQQYAAQYQQFNQAQNVYYPPQQQGMYHGPQYQSFPAQAQAVPVQQKSWKDDSDEEAPPPDKSETNKKGIINLSNLSKELPDDSDNETKNQKKKSKKRRRKKNKKDSIPASKSDTPPPTKPEVKKEVNQVAPKISKEETPKVKEEVKKEEPKPKIDEEKVQEVKKVKVKAHDSREHLNLVLIGHVDAGKSTISGQILLQTGHIDERTIVKYKKEAIEKNRESWWIAYIMDEDNEERQKGKTVECGRAHFDTKLKRYTILDAPGHKNYVPNMIQGAAQADIALLVVSARKNEFEAGFERGGQTREHALLALTLGITRVIIIINKMDECKYDEKRFNTIEKNIRKFLNDIGFKNKYIDCLPLSGQDGTNILKNENKIKWYKGKSLVETLDGLKKLKRNNNASLRIPVLDKYKGDKGVMIIGKIESGTLSVNDEVQIEPCGRTFKIISIEIDDIDVENAKCGENVLLGIGNSSNINMDQIFSGSVICCIKNPVPVSDTFYAQIYLNELPNAGIMTKGYQSVFHCHNISCSCELIDIPHKINKKNGKKSKIPPNFLRSHESAIALLKLDQVFPIEPFDKCQMLGRFTLRDSGKTVLIGKIQEVVSD